MWFIIYLWTVLRTNAADMAYYTHHALFRTKKSFPHALKFGRLNFRRPENGGMQTVAVYNWPKSIANSIVAKKISVFRTFIKTYHYFLVEFKRVLCNLSFVTFN